MFEKLFLFNIIQSFSGQLIRFFDRLFEMFKALNSWLVTSNKIYVLQIFKFFVRLDFSGENLNYSKNKQVSL